MSKEIKILTVDEIRSHKPNPETPFHNVYFELSAVPPPEWKEIFEKEFPFNKNLSGKKAWIDGRHIVIQSEIKEIDNVLQDLKKEVAQTNQKYHEEI